MHLSVTMRGREGMADKRAWLLGAIVFGWLGVAHGAGFSLDEAVAYALERNPQLLAAREQTSAAGARVRAAEAGHLPQLDVHYLARRSDNPLDAFADKLNTRSVTTPDFDPARLNDPDPSTLHNAGVALQWPVYTGGRIDAGIREAKHNEQAAALGYARAQEQITFQTIKAYRAAQAADAGLRIADDAVRAAQRHADTTARLLAQRRIVPSDKLTAEVNLALIQSNREQAAARRLSALSRLRLVMGLALDAALELEPWGETAEVPALEPLATIEQRALQGRRDLAAQQALWEASRSRIDVARAADKPQLSIMAAENWYDDNPGLANSSFSVMGVLSANLYSGGRSREEIRAAQHGANETAQRLEALKQQVRHEVREAYNAVNEARARVAICADNIGKARQTVELVRARYGEGRTILIDLLQAERVLVEARNEKLTAILKLAIAAASLRLAEGALEPASK